MHKTEAKPSTPSVSIATSATSAVRHKVLKLIAKNTFCTIATGSPAGHPHATGVVYAFADDSLWVHTLRTGRKARNIDSNDRVAVCIPFRRLPVGPPYTIHFQASAELLALDDPAVTVLLRTGALNGITAHGALEMADGCFVRIHPRGTIHSFGPGARIIDLVRDPLNAGARNFDYLPS